MKAPHELKQAGVGSFRAKLLVGMMLVISSLTSLGLYFAQRNVAANVERELQTEFQSDLAALHGVQEVRHAALAERCRALVQRPRIHAALEDDALDLLYLSARDELRDLMESEESPEFATHALHAKFYRFLDGNGKVIPPPNAQEIGELSAQEQSQIALGSLPDKQQIGYLERASGGTDEPVNEVIAMPIVSTESGQTIAALVVGFKPIELGAGHTNAGIKSGIWMNGQLHAQSVAPATQAALNDEVARAIAGTNSALMHSTVEVDATPHLLFYKLLNPDSLFPPAYEVCFFSLADSLARQRELRWQILGAGALLFLGGLAASHFISGRLSKPVEKLAVTSEENRAQRQRAEAALEVTSKELQRSARFSADASHQLKTPVTVLRAGLEELLARDDLAPEAREEVSALIHQTYRVTNIVEDLLLLAQMDDGRLKIDFHPVNISRMIEAMVDDLSALPDALDVEVDTDCPTLHIAGEERYVSLILQNLLENARKYNRPGGRIRIACHEEGDYAILCVGNTGRGISPAAREHIFERFHRGAMGENIPGHGLGLNLARELARLHGGDLRLARSETDWTEFEVRFRVARALETASVS